MSRTSTRCAASTSRFKQAARGRWAIVDPGTLLPPAPLDADPDDEADPRIALGLLEQAHLIRRHPDAPVSYSVHVGTSISDDSDAHGARDPLFAKLAQWAGLDAPGRTDVTFRTADACDLLDLSPLELGRLLATQPDLTEREGPRLVCLEMLPAGNDAGPRLNAILTRARREARARIRQVMTYAAGDLCRHVALANHLGEALPPCGTSCDICLSTADAGAESPAASTVDTTTARAQLTSADALTVLNAVRTLPFPMGKTGLARLLLGSVESRVRGDRSPAFGALKDFKKGKVERLDRSPRRRRLPLPRPRPRIQADPPDRPRRPCWSR